MAGKSAAFLVIPYAWQDDAGAPVAGVEITAPTAKTMITTASARSMAAILVRTADEADQVVADLKANGGTELGFAEAQGRA
jgi:hypothetical protein